MGDKKRVVALFSGGLDSTVMLYHLRKEYPDEEVLPFSVNYGQRHDYELFAADAVCSELNIVRTEVDLAEPMADVFCNSDSSQVGREVPVPHGHYADDTMKKTIVPNRNMLLIALAGAFAVSEGAHRVYYAAHQGDHPIYPDCRPDFFESCSITLRRATDHAVHLYAPFGRYDKEGIVLRGAELGVPFKLTWSCYDPQAVVEGEPGSPVRNIVHCGKCGTCVERKEAFELAEVADPTSYAA